MGIPLFAEPSFPNADSGAIMVRLTRMRPCLVGSYVGDLTWNEPVPGIFVLYRDSEKAGFVPTGIRVAAEVEDLSLHGFGFSGFDLMDPSGLTTLYDIVVALRGHSRGDLTNGQV